MSNFLASATVKHSLIVLIAALSMACSKKDDKRGAGGGGGGENPQPAPATIEQPAETQVTVSDASKGDLAKAEKNSTQARQEGERDSALAPKLPDLVRNENSAPFGRGGAVSENDPAPGIKVEPKSLITTVPAPKVINPVPTAAHNPDLLKADYVLAGNVSNREVFRKLRGEPALTSIGSFQLGVNPDMLSRIKITVQRSKENPELVELRWVGLNISATASAKGESTATFTKINTKAGAGLGLPLWARQALNDKMEVLIATQAMSGEKPYKKVEAVDSGKSIGAETRYEGQRLKTNGLVQAFNNVIDSTEAAAGKTPAQDFCGIDRTYQLRVDLTDGIPTRAFLAVESANVVVVKNKDHKGLDRLILDPKGDIGAACQAQHKAWETCVNREDKHAVLNPQCDAEVAQAVNLNFGPHLSDSNKASALIDRKLGDVQISDFSAFRDELYLTPNPSK
ncbi:MAG: hypothetical protein AB1540_05810 [Bdellovibrionota bacterium]